MSSLNNALIFLDRNGFLFFTQGLDRVLQFNFAPNVIRDLEVIDSDILASQVAAFVNQIKVQPFQAVILLSDGLLFEKQFASPITDDNKEVNTFLDNLPFEDVGKVVFDGESPTLVATNKQLYASLALCFNSLHNSVLAVIPAFTVEMDANKMLSLNSQAASDVFRKAIDGPYNFLKDKPLIKSSPVVKDTSFIQTPQEINLGQNAIKTRDDGGKTRLFILIAVFVLMLAVLGVVAFTML